ncbi:MAG: serine hydrolase [Roseiarcus sp.]|uniref:serine hydrolase domain-containing protein n=1 Tax=Roseiarcus sp. TaxID=1969460 RepID=UPI003C6AF858
MTDTLTRTFAGLPTPEPDEVGLSRPALKRLTTVMEREIAAGRAPGVSMLIARNGKVGFAKTLGALGPDGPAMPPDAIFRIYSMTKPIVSVAAMMLVEEGRMLITDPVSNFIPAFAETKVGVENGDGLDLVPLKRPITIQDLMRHTSGLTYGFTGTSKVQKLVAAANFLSQDRTLAEHVEALAALPLQHQPGEVWEYSVSTDVLGRVIEVIEGASLGEVLQQRLFGPLGIDDTAFFIPPSKVLREAKPMSPQVYTNLGVDPNSMTEPPRFESGGSGLLSSIGDYARFLAMLSSGGALDGQRILGPRTIRFMASDHLGPDVDRSSEVLPPGHGFGLGFGVRLQYGLAPTPGSVGDYFWGGWAGTTFRISPQDSLFAILMVQAPDYRVHLNQTFANLYTAALV